MGRLIAAGSWFGQAEKTWLCIGGNTGWVAMSMGLGVVSESLAVRATRGMQCLLVWPRIGCHY